MDSTNLDGEMGGYEDSVFLPKWGRKWGMPVGVIQVNKFIFSKYMALLCATLVISQPAMVVAEALKTPGGRARDLMWDASGQAVDTFSGLMRGHMYKAAATQQEPDIGAILRNLPLAFA